MSEILFGVCNHYPMILFEKKAPLKRNFHFQQNYNLNEGQGRSLLCTSRFIVLYFQ